MPTGCFIVGPPFPVLDMAVALISAFNLEWLFSDRDMSSPYSECRVDDDKYGSVTVVCPQTEINFQFSSPSTCCVESG